MRTYLVEAQRDTRFWFVEVPELGLATQARTLAEVEAMARDLIALTLDVPDDSFALEASLELPADAQAHLELARAARNEAESARVRAAAETRAAAHALKDSGMTLRDVGRALGVSYQRAHQLLGAP